jgi:transcriptional antiterminator NusG
MEEKNMETTTEKDMVEVENIEENVYFIVRTHPGKEDKLINEMSRIILKKEYGSIYSIFKPGLIKGYLFVECETEEVLTQLKDVLRGMPNHMGVIKNPIPQKEIEKYFEKKSTIININEKDIVEMIAGPFKGEKAKVIRRIDGKSEVVIEPLNMPVAIPITLNIDDVRVLKQEGI